MVEIIMNFHETKCDDPVKPCISEFFYDIFKTIVFDPFDDRISKGENPFRKSLFGSFDNCVFTDEICFFNRPFVYPKLV